MIAADPLYIAARRVLLDALDALAEHRRAVILVGAQAIYLQADEAELDASIAPFTKDADLGLDPQQLGNDPRIAEAMTAAGFVLKVKQAGEGGIEPGTWLSSAKVNGENIHVPVDLLVPEALAPGHGKRDARLPEHGKNAARWTPGLEAIVLDNTEMTIASLDPETDTRIAAIRVAGPAALLVAKAHKIAERVADVQRGRSHRLQPKDAGDVIRLMRSPTPPAVIGARLAELARDEMCGPSVRDGVQHLDALFGGRRARGVELAAEALAGALSEDSVQALAVNYIEALMAAYRKAATEPTTP